MSTPRPGAVRCLSRIGFHTMRYAEWGAADNPRVLLCLHGLTQYSFDAVSLIARLNVERVDLLGTSMGGLIGLSLAGQPNAPIGRLILNDVGPRMQLDALLRIGDYVGQARRFVSLDEATEYVRSISM